MLKFTIFILVFSSVDLLSSQCIPLVLDVLHRLEDKRVGKTEKQLDRMFIRVNKERLYLFYTVTPLVLGLIPFLLFHNFIYTLIGIGLGLYLPTVVIKNLQVMRKARFQAQLVDGLMILSSSLKGGLSLLQGIEVLVDEMPPPLSQELGLVLRENKMGVTLEESLKRLNERMDLEEVKLLTNSILVARETGGDLTKVLSRLSTTIRDNRKLKETIRTLTLQGRLQGVIMSVLPFIFILTVLSFNREHFEVMFQSETGRMLLFAAVILQAIGLMLIQKFSKIRI